MEEEVKRESDSLFFLSHHTFFISGNFNFASDNVDFLNQSFNVYFNVFSILFTSASPWDQVSTYLLILNVSCDQIASHSSQHLPSVTNLQSVQLELRVCVFVGVVCLCPGGFIQRNKLRHLFCSSSSLIELFTKCPGHRLPRTRKKPPSKKTARWGLLLQLWSLRSHTHTHTHTHTHFVSSWILLKCYVHTYMHERIYVCICVIFKSNTIDPWRRRAAHTLSIPSAGYTFRVQLQDVF